MTRGRPPKKGLGEALPVALARGTVMCTLQNGESVCDLIIIGKDQVVLIRVRKARRIRVSQQETEREYQEPILRLRSFPAPGPVIRELWIYSRYGIWRFFRIEDTGIVEICQDGMLLKNPFRVVAMTVRAVYARKKGTRLVKEG